MRYFPLPVAHEPEVDSIYAGQRGNKHAEGAENHNESTRCMNEAPGIDHIGDDAHSYTAACNVDVLRVEGCKIHATRDGILCEVDLYLRYEEADTCEEASSPCGSVVMLCEQHL